MVRERLGTTVPSLDDQQSKRIQNGVSSPPTQVQVQRSITACLRGQEKQQERPGAVLCIKSDLQRQSSALRHLIAICEPRLSLKLLSRHYGQ